MHGTHEQRRKDAGETNLPDGDHSTRYKMEYARGNICTPQMRDTLDRTIGAEKTNEITKLYGLSTIGLRDLNTHERRS